jgi:hydroxymethylglutaryl-CoA reductase (NADPH)
MEGDQVRRFVARLTQARSRGEVQQGLARSYDTELPRRIQNSAKCDPASIEKRREIVGAEIADYLSGGPLEGLGVYERHIENLIGEIRMPVGVAGPLRIRGLFAHGCYYVPLATHEATLVASYNRGCRAITDAGGCTAVLLAEGVTRSPGFEFACIEEAGRFAIWVAEHETDLEAAALTTTHHGKLDHVSFTIEGNHLYLHLGYITEDAAGQNMVTLATQAVCEFLSRECPVKPRRMYVEANMSGDKKATMQSFLSVRGKKVTAEIVIPAEIISTCLRTSAKAMVDYWRISAMGGVLSGAIGVQGHYANGLAALFLATGQDVACVSEASVGVTRMEEMDNNALYAAVTLPNLIVGTVGGGTGLPSQATCLKLMGLQGQGRAAAFAEVCGALCLAGELSIIAALSAGHFAAAHGKLARGRGKTNGHTHGL